MSEKDKQKLKEYQKNYRPVKKINQKNLSFFFKQSKNGKKVLIFDKQCINKNAFHRNKRTISTDKVDTKRSVV